MFGWVQTFDDRAGDVGVLSGVGFAVQVALGDFKVWFAERYEIEGVEGKFAVREESVKRTLVIRFLEGMLCFLSWYD